MNGRDARWKPVALIVGVLSFAAAVHADWRMPAHDPQRTSYSAESANVSSLAWYQPIPEYIPSRSHVITVEGPSAAEDKLFVTTADGVYSLDPANGNTRWFYDMDLPSVVPLEIESLEEVRLIRDLPLGALAAMTSSSVRFIREINGTLHKGALKFKANGAGSPIVHTIHVPKGAREVALKALKSQGYIRETS